MKLLREVFIIFGIYFIGEMVSVFLPIPLPGNLIGMLLLLILLSLRIVHLDQISTISDFLLGHLSFFFIPAGVGLLSVLSLIQHTWLAILILCLVTTFLTMGFSGKFVEIFMKRKGDDGS